MLQNGNIRGNFRTHDKFSKCIYYAFKPLWWAFHYLDEPSIKSIMDLS